MSTLDLILARLDARLDSLVTRIDLSPLAGRRLFLTGCTGFVGGWLLHAVAALNRRGADIRAIALSRDPQGFAHRQPRLARASWLTLMGGDAASFVAAPVPVDVAILGAAPVTPAALADSAATCRTIIEGSRRALAWSEACGARRILCLSSGAVYGEQSVNAPALAENHPCLPPVGDTYAEAKLAMEALAFAHGRNTGGDTVVARLFAFSGAWLPDHLAVTQLLKMALSGQAIRLQSDGSPVRSYLDGADMALWLLALAAHAPGGTVCNVGSDQAISLAQLARLISQRYRADGGVSLGKALISTRCRYVPDITLARRQFGLQAWTPLEDALDEHCAWVAALLENSRP